MKKTIINIVSMIGVGVFLFLGTVGQNHGAANVATFFIWVFSLASFSYLSEQAIANLVKDPSPFTTPWISFPFQIASLVIMAWYGWIWTASIYIVSCILGLYAREEWKSRRGELA